MKKYYLILLVFLLFACDKSPYKGYSKVSNDFYYLLAKPSLVEPGEEANSLLLSITIVDKNDSLVFESKKMVQSKILTHSFSPGTDFYNFHKKLANADDIKIIASTNQLKNWLQLENIPFFTEPNEMLYANILVHKKLNAAQFETENFQLSRLSRDPDVKEQSDLNKFLRTVFDNPDEHFINGIYFFLEKEGNGVFPTKGQKVKVKYKGFLLSGEPFDHLENEPITLEIEIGKEQQLLAGLERALPMLDFGARAKVIFSSALAYGDRGSYEGHVKPYTSVIYDIQLIE